MYILREQGALVTVNSTILHKFESTITKPENHIKKQTWEADLLNLKYKFSNPRSRKLLTIFTTWNLGNT